MALGCNLCLISRLARLFSVPSRDVVCGREPVRAGQGQGVRVQRARAPADTDEDAEQRERAERGRARFEAHKRRQRSNLDSSYTDDTATTRVGSCFEYEGSPGKADALRQVRGAFACSGAALGKRIFPSRAGFLALPCFLGDIRRICALLGAVCVVQTACAASVGSLRRDFCQCGNFEVCFAACLGRARSIQVLSSKGEAQEVP